MLVYQRVFLIFFHVPPGEMPRFQAAYDLAAAAAADAEAARCAVEAGMLVIQGAPVRNRYCK